MKESRPTSKGGIAASPDEVVDDAVGLFLRKMVEAEHFSGVAMVSQGGNVLHKRAYGPSAEGRQNRLDARFHVGSVTKQFTAAAIMQLVEKGKVTGGDPVNTLLPDVYRSEIWAKILLHHLLSHTSGIPDYAVIRDYYEVTDGWAFDATIDGMIREAMESPLNFAPGAQFQYSNIGYTLLGKIIEAQTGRSYARYIKEELLDPLGMKQSEIHDEHYVPLSNEASGLRWNEELGSHTGDDIVSLPVTPADGGLVTTLDDFARWVTVYRHMAHPRLSKASLERMLQPIVPIDANRWPGRDLRGRAFYGLGLMRSGDLVMHEGSIVGFRSFFIYSLDDDLLIAIFSNNTANDVFRIAEGVFKLAGRPEAARVEA